MGQHTLFMSKCSDEVISFEPFEPVRMKLLQKLEENKIRNVRVFPIGLGARDEDLAFFHRPMQLWERDRFAERPMPRPV